MINEEKQSNASTESIHWPALVFAIVFPTIVTFIYFNWLQSADASLQQGAYGILKFLQFGFPVAFVFLLDRTFFKRPISNHENRKSNGFGLGILFGLFVVALMMGVYYGFLADSQIGTKLIEGVKEKISGMKMDSVVKFAGMGVFYALVHSFMEEYYWRWFVFGQLRKQISLVPSILISSLGFMAHHVLVLAFFFGWGSPLTYLISFSVAVGGAFWAYLYHSTGRLFAPWLSHLIVDAGIFFLGYLLIKDMLH